jgi:hypothetical protein
MALCIIQGNQEFVVSILSTLFSKDELKSLKMSWGCCQFVTLSNSVLEELLLCITTI